MSIGHTSNALTVSGICGASNITIMGSKDLALQHCGV